MINFKHLHYFWMVAKKGSIARASETLHLTPQTISGQLSMLEDQLGESLFSRSGRNLVLTDVGQIVLSYAEEIFSLGGELEEMVRSMPLSRRLVFTVGVADVVPKSIAHRLLDPALHMDKPIRIVCREGAIDNLLADLALHKLDIVIADGPIPSRINIKGYNHLLGETSVSFFGTPKLVDNLSAPFPKSLNKAPLLVPSESAVVRGRLAKWFEKYELQPNYVGEFEDSALMKAFGRAGAGFFIAPSPLAKEVEEQYGVVCIGQTDEVHDQIYAITVERKISHPSVALVMEEARKWLASA